MPSEESTNVPSKSKIIVFTQYRDTLEMIHQKLEKEGIKSAKFFGQASKDGEKGLTQKQQKAIIKSFRMGEYDVLLSTSVAEEGIDIPAVDLVILYEPVPSEVRMIQRRGRTGRKRTGRVKVLITNGTRDEGYYWASINKESRMKNQLIDPDVLEELNASAVERMENQKNVRVIDKPKEENDFPIVYADSREGNSKVIRHLTEMEIDVKVQSMAVADYQVSDEVAIERKTAKDFVDSIVDKRLFKQAKEKAPCIVFIDEIDAIGQKRNTGGGMGGHDEREQTLNQLLVEMDGFGVNEGIIVMAATNRVDILDPAILRPGRFDRKVVVGRPDVKGREEILGVHVKNKPLADDVDLKEIAQTTAGFTGADLENLLNEAAISAANDDRVYINREDIKKSFIKIGIGKEKKSRVITEKEKRITAYHEAGHAILFHKLPDVGPVYTISIIPTGNGAAGYTMPLPEKDEMFNTKGRMRQEIIVDLAGRAAEELIFDDITTGASQDIKVATKTARAMITRYGFSDTVGMINYDNDDDEVFIGRDLAHTRAYSEEVARTIDAEVKTIIDECYEEAKRILMEYKDVLDACATLLIEKERIGRSEFEALFPENERGQEMEQTLLDE